jgi:hypothetical protein
MGNLDRYYDLPTERPFRADPGERSFKADPDERSFEADQGERPFKADQGESSERVFRFPGTTPSATSSRGCVAALDLVSQAAEVIKGIENHASESEKHVRSIADKALQRLQLAESRIEELETELQSAQACIREARVKIKESTESANIERSRLEAAERKMCQIEMRARTAEAQAKENANTVARIEEAIRVQILEKRLPSNKFHS